MTGKRKGIPVFVVAVMYDDGTGELKIQKYMLEHEDDAMQMAEMIKFRSVNLTESPKL